MFTFLLLPLPSPTVPTATFPCHPLLPLPFTLRLVTKLSKQDWEVVREGKTLKFGNMYEQHLMTHPLDLRFTHPFNLLLYYSHLFAMSPYLTTLAHLRPSSPSLATLSLLPYLPSLNACRYDFYRLYLCRFGALLTDMEGMYVY